jgi:hypothetical protein
MWYCYATFLKLMFDCDEGARRAPSSQSNIFFCQGYWIAGQKECRGRSPLPEREVPSLLLLFSLPQAAK